jgi:hypothetical protein
MDEQGFNRAEKKPQISPLRFAPVEMTILLSHSRPSVDWIICRFPRNKIVISTGVLMGLRPTQGSSHHFPYNHNPFLCHPERSRGICSSADLSWICFS